MRILKDLYRKYHNFFPADLWAFLLMIVIILIGVIFFV